MLLAAITLELNPIIAGSGISSQFFRDQHAFIDLSLRQSVLKHVLDVMNRHGAVFAHPPQEPHARPEAACIKDAHRKLDRQLGAGDLYEAPRFATSNRLDVGDGGKRARTTSARHIRDHSVTE